MKYKLIVTDMDGTLLGSDNKVTDENKVALGKAIKKGISVAIATGRLYDSAKLHTGFLEKKVSIIACNGALIKESESGKIIYSNYMDTEICLDVMSIFEKYNAYYQCYTDDTLICKEVDGNTKRYQELDDIMGKGMKVIVKSDIREYILNNDILKMIVVEDDDLSILDKIKEEISYIKGVEVTKSWFNNIEVMNKGVNKGNAVNMLAKYLHINKEDIIAFGDNYNDLSMIEYVGMGVAMGNADDFIKEKADYVTETNNDSGVAKALYNLL